MKKIDAFILPNCPHCRQAKTILANLLEQPEFSDIELVYHDESVEKELAESYDYYYVPTLFSGKNKLHEGRVDEAKLKEALSKA